MNKKMLKKAAIQADVYIIFVTVLAVLIVLESMRGDHVWFKIGLAVLVGCNIAFWADDFYNNPFIVAFQDRHFLISLIISLILYILYLTQIIVTLVVVAQYVCPTTQISDKYDSKVLYTKDYIGDVKLDKGSRINSSICIKDKNGYLTNPKDIYNLPKTEHSEAVLKYIPLSQKEHVKIQKIEGTGILHYKFWKDVPVKTTVSNVYIYAHKE